MIRMFSSTNALNCEQYNRWKSKSKSKKEILSHSIRVRHVWELILYMDHTIPQSMDMKMQNPLSSLLHALQGKSEKALSSNILMLVQMTLLMDNALKFIWHAYDKPINSYTFIDDEPRRRSSRTQQHSDVSSRTQQHSDVQNLHPDFQVKASGSQDTWHKIIGHPPTATRAKKFYK